jgi:hypothetical protein
LFFTRMKGDGNKTLVWGFGEVMKHTHIWWWFKRQVTRRIQQSSTNECIPKVNMRRREEKKLKFSKSFCNSLANVTRHCQTWKERGKIHFLLNSNNEWYVIIETFSWGWGWKSEMRKIFSRLDEACSSDEFHHYEIKTPKKLWNWYFLPLDELS